MEELHRPLLELSHNCKVCKTLENIVNCSHCYQDVCIEPFSCSLSFPDVNDSEMFVCIDCYNSINAKLVPLKKVKKKEKKTKPVKPYVLSEKNYNIYSPIVSGN